MDLIIQPLQLKDVASAADLDKKWFGEYGISVAELTDSVRKNPSETLALIQNNQCVGFATFEILDGNLPHEYSGTLISQNKILFIRQFTTKTNYEVGGANIDVILLDAIEKKARALDCAEVWEALAVDHPYRKENNAAFDAFGFYESRGYILDLDQNLVWSPDSSTMIDCLLFKKSFPG